MLVCFRKWGLFVIKVSDTLILKLLYFIHMAVRKDSETSEEAKFTIVNGDLAALNRIKQQYGLKDGDNVIVFALGVLSKAEGRPVTIENNDGTTTALLPSDDLKK